MAKLILEKVLKKKSMSKRRFAKELDVDYASSFRYYRDGYDPKLSTLTKWARVLKVRVSDLYTRLVDEVGFELLF